MKGDDVGLRELLCSEAIRVSFGLKGMLRCLPNHKVQGFVQKSSRMKNYYYFIGNNGDCQFVFLIALDKSGRISYTEKQSDEGNK